ncbi:GH32 C-terminal domain-containing protein [Dactylosporangium sp. McL0621]|uniref:GH32 C-terminal domain-containing protein n=1 Tax=Dactylosporangium sp. McL0621 TaxID=3415678 RepID=UPI003CF2D6E0
MRRFAVAVLAVLLLFAPAVAPSPARAAVPTDIVNADFETGDLSGWAVTGTTFGNAVTTETGWGWGCCFGQHGTHHVWGFRSGGDAATGTLTSSQFQLSGTGQVSFLIGGGNDADNLYVALVRAGDGAVLFRATGRNDESYQRVNWDASAYLGQTLYVRAVDSATGGWGHLNLDDVRVFDTQAVAGLVNPDFETGDLSGWTVTGTTFSNAVTTATGWGWGCCFGQHGTHHVWGFGPGGDAATGTLTSSQFRLSGTGQVSFLIGGGNDAGNLYVALVRAGDGAILFRATGRNDESYQRVNWDASAYLGQTLYVRAVDSATGGWGHLNLDDVRLDEPAPSDLLAHWSFDETTGSTARDSASGRDDPINYVFNNAVYKPSTPPMRRPGVASNALLFDGYSTWISRSGFATPTQALTLEAWVAPRAFEWGDEHKLSAVIDQHDEGARQGFILGIGRHGTWSFQAGIAGTWQALWADPAKPLARNQWHHIVATFDAASQSMRVYLNGSLAGSLSTPAGGITPYTGNLQIGRHNQGVVINGTFTVNMFAGLLDEVELRSRALTAAEVSAAYRAVAAVPTPDLAMQRSRYAGDAYRPQYHFMAPEHWMNEPHAPMYANGQYHLFYQHNQQGPYWHNIGWGHGISPDLVHWRDAPEALVPTAGTAAPDGVWSGSAAVDASGQPLLFITAGDDSVSPNQRTGIARDPGWRTDNDLNTWTIDQAPVTVQSPGLDVGPGRKVRYGEFRDPYVWRDGNTWYQLVGSGVQTTSGADVGGTALLYTSTDATNWTYSGPLMVGDAQTYPKTGQVWELPVFLPLGGGKYILLTNPMWTYGTDNNVKYVWYWIGSWNPASRTFTPDTTVPRLWDYGEHFTGPSGFVDQQGRSVVFSIAQDKRTEQAHYDSGWAHNAGLPIVLSQGADGDVAVKPLPELTTLHRTTTPDVSITTDTTVQAANQQLSAVRGDMLHITLEMTGTGRYGIKLRRSPDGGEETTLYYDAGTGTLSIDRTKSGSNSSLYANLGVQGGPLNLAGQNLKLDIYLDKSMIEAYADDRRAITSRVYPARTDSLGIQVWTDGNATVKNLNVWQMNPAYN